MKKTLTVNISGMVFHIDEDAYGLLKKYLDSIRTTFQSMEGGNEVYEDIEVRIAELFSERMSNSRQVISSKDVDEVIAILGHPEDISGNFDQSHSNSYRKKNKRMYRDPDSQIIAGVCSGLSAYWHVDPVIVRIVFVVLTLFGMAGVIIYLILWLVLPEARTVAQKLEMRGEPVNLSNMGAFFRDEFENVKRNFTKK